MIPGSNQPPPPPLPPEMLDYRAAGGVPGAYPPRRAVFSVGSFIATTAVMLVLLGIFWFVMPQLENAFKDFGVKLPAVTAALLHVSRLLHTPGGLVFGVMIAGSIGVLVAVLPFRGRGLRLLLTLILGVIVLVVALAVLLPLMGLMQSMSGGKM